MEGGESMRTKTIFLLLALTSASGCVTNEAEPDRADSDAVVRAVEGRTAGTPQSCVSSTSPQSLRALDDRTLAFEDGPILWVNRLDAPCPGLRSTDPISIEKTGNQYCRNDRFRPLNPVT